MNEDAKFYVAQKAFILKGVDILVLNDPIEGLDYPGGKIRENENDATESLKREVLEETGLQVAVGEPFCVAIETFASGHRLAGEHAYVVFYRCEYISGDVSLSEEHDSFHWVNKDNYHAVNDGTSYFNILTSYFS